MLFKIHVPVIAYAFIFCMHTNLMAQQGLNNVRSYEALKPNMTEVEIISASRIADEVRRTTNYVDGFGRPVQTVIRQMSPSPSAADLVEMHTYDNMGREVQQKLPFVSNVTQAGDIITDGNYKPSAQQQQLVFNQQLFPGENNFYYTQVDYENSPANRVLNVYPAGNNWVGNASGSQVRQIVNTSVDNVRKWDISNTAQGGVPVSNGYYDAGVLYKTSVLSEQGKQTIEFKDRDGRIILKKAQLTAIADPGTGSNQVGWLCTYYVYDDYNNLRFVIPPKAVNPQGTVPQILADELCTRYEYDARNMLIIKKTPGVGEQRFVNDQRGRMVLSQDANQRSNQQWQYYRYDNLDRLIATGLITDAANYNNLMYHVNAAAGSIAYPNLASYTSQLLCETYYDNYNWISGTGFNLAFDQSDYTAQYFYPATHTSFPYPEYNIANAYPTRGLVTGSKTKVLGSGANYVYSASYYDNKGRMVQVQTTNLSGQVDITTTQYSWKGIPLRTLEKHVKGGTNPQTHRVLTKFNYDHAGRLLSVTKTINSTIGGTTINSAEKTIASYTYDQLGQLTGKSLGIHPTLGTPLETITYDYNIQGWTTGINKSFIQAGNTSNYFGMELAYDKTSSITGTATYLKQYFNGNLAGVTWKTKGDGIPRKYDYNYDAVDRLTNAQYKQNTTGSTWNSTDMDYSVFGKGASDAGFTDGKITYDENGNILTMSQRGFKLGQPVANIDCMNYVYDSNGVSNRIRYISDSCNDPGSKLGDLKHADVNKGVAGWKDYEYDANGNVRSDFNRNISTVVYSEILNLPLTITVTGKGTISYYYDAAGNKLQKTVQENNVAVPFNGTNYTTNITTITTYHGGFVYQSKNYSNTALASLNRTESLLYVMHEEGRARIATPQVGSPYYAFDYYLRDHQDNVRVTLTDEVQQDTYPAATLESGGIISEQSYYNIVNDANHIINVSSLPWYAAATGSNYQNNNGVPAPPDPTTNPTATSTRLYKLNGATGDRFGMGIALKVMAGDMIHLFGKSVWHNNGQTTNNANYALNSVIGSFINAFAGTGAVASGSKGAATGSVLNANTNTTVPLAGIFSQTPVPAGQTPKAYINWILFDEQFRPVANGSGADPISVTADVVKTHTVTGIPIAKSGYLYIYCSNESNQDVYFDNFQVVHNRGPLIEERHYYPAGLTMFAISSRAAGKLQNNFGYQEKELQTGEFNDGSGLEQYDFEARYYDPQTGRWWVPDPAEQFASPYMAMGNHWVNYRDPNGKWFGVDDIWVAAIGFVVGYVSYGLTQDNWGGKALLSGLAGAAIAEAGYLTLGGGLAAGPGSFATAATGNAGTLMAAQSFSLAYYQTAGMSVAMHYDQLKDASDWGALGLIAGYSLVSSLSAGLSTKSTIDKIDAFFGIDKAAKTGSLLYAKGAPAAAIKSFVSGFGNRVLESYDPRSNTWNTDLGNIFATSLFIDGGGAYISKTFSSSNFVNNYAQRVEDRVLKVVKWKPLVKLAQHIDKLVVNRMTSQAVSLNRLFWEEVIFPMWE